MPRRDPTVKSVDFVNRRQFAPGSFFVADDASIDAGIDASIIDDIGCVRIVGRRRKTIPRGGRQAPPCEANDQLRAHPAVNDVRVIGVPHDILGELVCACIVGFPVSFASLTRSP
jgi:non-ribosomal peptide synthetase component E (peptide arylation enzyme)